MRFGGGNSGRRGGKQWNNGGAGRGGNRNNNFNNNNNTSNDNNNQNSKPSSNTGLTCFKCGGAGHKAFSCKKKWCDFCSKPGHNESVCRKKNSQAKMANDSQQQQAVHSFQFMAGESAGTGNNYSFSECYNLWTVLNAVIILGILFLGTLIFGPAIAAIGVDATSTNCYFVKSKMGKGGSMLVDSGASSHIITDESRFCSIDKDFKPQNHFVELADGTKHNKFALKRGSIEISLQEKTGKIDRMMLHHVLYIPTFPMDIFSVPAATENEAEVLFRKQSSELTLKNGSKFEVKKRQNLFFLDNVFSVSTQEVVNAVSDKSKMARKADLYLWHRIMGHCNKDDVIRLENIVDGMIVKKKDEF